MGATCEETSDLAAPILFCFRCASFAQCKLGWLAEVCCGAPSSVGSARCLRRVLSGRHPTHGSAVLPPWRVLGVRDLDISGVSGAVPGGACAALARAHSSFLGNQAPLAAASVESMAEVGHGLADL